MCIYRALDRKTHKIEKNWLCTESRSVCIAIGVETPHATRKERAVPLDIYTVNGGGVGVTPTLHTEVWVWLVLVYIWNDFTMVIAVIRKSLSLPPPTSSLLKCLRLVFLFNICGTKALEATTDALNFATMWSYLECFLIHDIWRLYAPFTILSIRQHKNSDIVLFSLVNSCFTFSFWSSYQT